MAKKQARKTAKLKYYEILSEDVGDRKEFTPVTIPQGACRRTFLVSRYEIYHCACGDTNKMPEVVYMIHGFNPRRNSYTTIPTRGKRTIEDVFDRYNGNASRPDAHVVLCPPDMKSISRLG